MESVSNYIIGGSIIVFLVICLAIYSIIKTADYLRDINKYIRRKEEVEYWENEFWKLYRIGRNQQALEALEQLVWLKTKKVPFRLSEVEHYNNLKEQYEHLFVKLGGKFMPSSLEFFKL